MFAKLESSPLPKYRPDFVLPVGARLLAGVAPMPSPPDSTAEFLPPLPPPSAYSQIPPCELLLRQLITSSVILLEDWEKQSAETQRALIKCDRSAELLSNLMQVGLLTGFQAKRIARGKRFGLVVGNYRILSRLGKGAMGEVFKAEHIELRKIVAIKAVEILDLHDPVYLRRFHAEMRMVAQLHHPNIVVATDAGRCTESGPDGQTLWYFVMDYVHGENLEYLVRHGEPLEPRVTCDIAHQIASALAEANKRDLVHRDIKPANILLTKEGQAKLLDFGLARNLSSRDTRRGALLGTIHYMSPEQASDASTVDIRSDIFSLGATMYWCLTGQRPFAEKSSLMQTLLNRSTEPPPRIRRVRPDLSTEMEGTIVRMMAVKVTDRFQTPQQVMAALEPFLKEETREQLAISPRPHSVADLLLELPPESVDSVTSHRSLIVTSDSNALDACRKALARDSIECDVAIDGSEALMAAKRKMYDVVLVDLELDGMSGSEVCKRLRENGTVPHQKIIAIAPAATADEAVHLMLKYVNDFLAKPISGPQLRVRVLAALCAKDQQDNSDRLNQHLAAGKRGSRANKAVESKSSDSSVWIID